MDTTNDYNDEPDYDQMIAEDQWGCVQLSQQRETLLQERVDVLLNDLTEERRHRARAEDELSQVREFNNRFECPLVPKSPATRDIEEADQFASDLHAEDVTKPREECDSHVIAIEAEFDKFRAEAEEKYQLLLEEAEAQGFRRGTLGTSSSGAQAFTSEAFRQLKDFLKRRMPDETKELMAQGFSGITLPAYYGGGDALDRICSLWAGIALPYMSPEAGRMNESGRGMLTAIISGDPSGLAFAEAYEHQLDVWRKTEWRPSRPSTRWMTSRSSTSTSGTSSLATLRSQKRTSSDSSARL